MKVDGYGGVSWKVAAILLFLLLIVLLGLAFYQPPAKPPPPTPVTPVPVTRTPTRTPRPEDLWTKVEEPKDLLFWRGVLWVVGHTGKILAIDPKTMRVVKTIGTDGKAAWGIAVTEFGGKAKIAVTHGNGNVAVINPDHLLLTDQVDLHGRLGRPAALGRYLFIPIHDQGTVVMIDMFPEKPAERLVKRIKTEAAPFAAAVNFATGEVLVTHRDTNKIAILDGQTGRLKGLYPIGGARSLYSLATEPTLGTVFVSYAAEADADRPDRLAVFRYDFSKRLDDIQTCHLGEGGQIVAGNSLGIKVFLACHGEDKVLSFPLHTGASHTVYTVGNFPFGLAFDEEGNHLFVGLKNWGETSGENKAKRVW